MMGPSLGVTAFGGWPTGLGRQSRFIAAQVVREHHAVTVLAHDDQVETTILSGLHSTSSEPPPGVTGADHWVAAAFLCAEKPKKTAGADVRAGTTIDQIIAQKIGRETLLPSMEMAVEDPGANSSNCGEGYSCVYTNTIAWASPTQPLPMI